MTINDKHIEVIVRQMLQRVRIAESGDTAVPPRRDGAQAGLREGERAHHRQGWRPAVASPLLLGITKASLSTDSFLGVFLPGDDEGLTQAAISGTVD
ncbi:MAG: hypothetical protein R3B99_02780 [Polyangiales bacterium]